MKHLLALFTFGLSFGTSLLAQSGLNTDRQIFLNLHNQAREEVGIAPLVWSDDLAAYAQEWADHLAANGCDLQHRNGGSYGENIYWGSHFDEAAAQHAVESWLSEQSAYRGEKFTSRTASRCGHYTQIVWEKSTQLGCGVARCSDGGVIVICNYDPSGNYLGEYPYGH